MEQADLDQPIYGLAPNEQMSVDQAFRSRLQFVLAQSSALFGQVQFADAKAGTLLALVGLLAAHIAGGGIGAGPVAMAALLGLNGGVIALCVAVLIPRVSGDEARQQISRRDRYSWPALAGDVYGPDEHADFLRSAHASQLIVSVARSNTAVARILLTKFRILRVAFLFVLLDVAATLLVASLNRPG